MGFDADLGLWIGGQTVVIAGLALLVVRASMLTTARI